MNKEDYIKITKKKFRGKARKIVLEQMENYYNILNHKISYTTYKEKDSVYLKKGTLLHGTYRNIEGLTDIVNNGLIASLFTNGRLSKYPSCVSVWNLKDYYKLSDYINYYSGGTIKYSGLLINNEYSNTSKTEIIPFDKMSNINNYILNNPARIWIIEQTKEARFMPSLIQDKVEIAIIYNNNECINKLLNGDILNTDNIDDKTVKDFINKNYDINSFISCRYNKDDFFTDRESAVLFGIPNNFIEGILVGRMYEKDNNILNEIKRLLPNCYICNLDGRVIVGNE